MITVPLHGRIYVYTAPVDFRRSYDGLATLIDSCAGQNSTSGCLFMFTNRRSTQVKLLFWDRDGYCIMMKRLEAGTFRRTRSTTGDVVVEIDRGALSMLLEGIEATSVRRRRRYSDGR